MGKLPKKETEKKKNRVSLLVLTTVLILFGTYHPVFSIIAFGVCCFVMFVEEKTFFLCFLFYIMPMAGIFKLSPGSSSLFTYLELLFVGWHFVKTRFRITQGELLAFFFAAYIVITGSIYTSLEITRTLKLFLNLMLLGYLAELDPEKDHKQLFQFFIYGVLISSVMRLLNSSVFPITQYVVEKTERFAGISTVRFAGLYSDPNYYSVNVIIAMCLILVLYKRRELTFVETVMLNIPMVVFVGMTGSKSAFLMLVLPVLLIIYICTKNRNYFALVLCVLILIGIIILGIDGRLELFDYVLYRLSKTTTSADAMTTGRTAIWRRFAAFFLDNPVHTLVGNGGMEVVLDGHAPHNTYIDLLFQFGVIGTGLYLTTVGLMIRKNIRKVRRNAVNCSVWLVVLVMYMFLSELQSYDMTFHLVIACMVWNLKN